MPATQQAQQIPATVLYSPEVAGWDPTAVAPPMNPLGGTGRAAANLERMGRGDLAGTVRAAAVPFDWNRSEPNNPMAADLYRYRANPALWDQRQRILERKGQAPVGLADQFQLAMSGEKDPNAAWDKWGGAWTKAFGENGLGFRGRPGVNIPSRRLY